jgi:hypothetical protein
MRVVNAALVFWCWSSVGAPNELFHKNDKRWDLEKSGMTFCKLTAPVIRKSVSATLP